MVLAFVIKNYFFASKTIDNISNMSYKIKLRLGQYFAKVRRCS